MEEQVRRRNQLIRGVKASLVELAEDVSELVVVDRSGLLVKLSEPDS